MAQDEFFQDILLVITVVTTYGLPTTHKYSIPKSVEGIGELFEETLTEASRAVVGTSPILMLKYPFTMYKPAHIIRVTITMEGPEDAAGTMEQVEQQAMGFLSHGR